jgi:hypothetical protein
VKASEDIKYRGGEVMLGTPNLYNIYFGNLTRETVSLVDYFSKHLGGSYWYNITTVYYQNISSQGGLKYMSNSLNYSKAIFHLPNAKKLTLTELDIERVIVDLILSEQLPIDTNGIYGIIFRGDFTVCYANTYCWPRDFCGYHSVLQLPTGEFMKYFAVGDSGTAPGITGFTCQQIRSKTKTANADVGADSLVSIYAHEVTEITSDPFSSGWMFDNGDENADRCGFNFGTIYLNNKSNSNVRIGDKNFLVQQNWLPGFGCRNGYP